jgi:phosphate transport system permease protein
VSVPTEPQPPAATGQSRGLRGRRIADRVAALFIAAGGISVIIAILLIFLFVGREAWPLLLGSRVATPQSLAPSADPAPLLVGGDSFQDLAWWLGGNGGLSILDRVRGGMETRPLPLDSLEVLTCAALDGGVNGDRFIAGTSEGRLLQGRLRVRRVLDGDPVHSTVRLSVEEIGLPEEAVGGAIRSLAWARGDDQSLLAWLAESQLHVAVGADDDDWKLLTLPDGIGEENWSLLAVAPSGEHFALVAPDGGIAVLEAPDGEVRLATRMDSGLRDPRSLCFLIGSGRIVVGGVRGRLATLMESRDETGRPSWIPGMALEGHRAPLSLLVPGPRDRSLLSLDESGQARLHYATTGRTLARTELPQDTRVAGFSPRGDALLTAGAGGLQVAALDNPHPEISFRALFGQLHYEGYLESLAIWQSTGGSDEFEPKFSVLPLIFGTLKGTLYALLISVPLSLLGAIYISQFAPTGLARLVKPAIEIMAALPSVIIGFLAGLVFAPYLETHLTAVLTFAVLLPLLILLMVPIWQRIPGHRLGPKGLPQLLQGLVLSLVALSLAYTISPWIDAQIFGGSLIGWLHDKGGLVYDQRNALVVGFALGFAVIPIIFTMAEDALSNVPDSLISASLALGASRWTTVARVVLPGAAAGVFAAIMIGLGRAIGETMIVLMATGNTPLMDISPFNGFRALSACIAVEIPEAPVGGTLYRVLFLLALLLFLFTFVLNTGATWIGEHLRKRHGRF